MRTIGVIGTGDMGSGVARALTRAGLRVVADLTGRSAHSLDLAARAGIEDVGRLERVIEESELVLSIVPPAAARAVAEAVAARMRQGAPAFADCNAIAPAHVRELALHFDGIAPFVDVGIVGRPPDREVKVETGFDVGRPPDREAETGTRFYVCGSARACVLGLDVPGIRFIDMGPEVGRASAIKMAYSSLNKGVDALLTAVLLAAEQLGVRDELMAELEGSQRPLLERMRARVPFLAATSERFAPEMLEVASTYADADVTGRFHEGAAWVYTQLARSSLATETRATLPADRSLDEAIAAFAEAAFGNPT